MEEVFSTSALSPGERVTAWNEAASRNLSPMEVAPRDAKAFAGQMLRRDLYEVCGIDIQSEGATVRRSMSHVSLTRNAVFMLDLQVTGRSVIRQAGREARLQPGDFVLTDNTRPHEVHFDESVSMRLLRVPAPLIRRFVGCPEELVGIRVDGNSGTGRIASQFVRSLWDGSSRSSLIAGSSHIERAALELIAGAFAPYRQQIGDGGTSLKSLHRVQIIEFIEDRIGDAELCPATVAEALRISPRYLHRIFGQDGETVGRYILRRRLERAAEQLADPLHYRRQISDIAFSCGFVTQPHFCRAFRERFGLPPGEYRELNLRNCGSPQRRS